MLRPAPAPCIPADPAPVAAHPVARHRAIVVAAAACWVASRTAFAIPRPIVARRAALHLAVIAATRVPASPPAAIRFWTKSVRSAAGAVLAIRAANARQPIAARRDTACSASCTEITAAAIPAAAVTSRNAIIEAKNQNFRSHIGSGSYFLRVFHRALRSLRYLSSTARIKKGYLIGEP